MAAGSSKDDLARQAKFIFDGTVKTIKAATISTITPDDKTIVVTVNAVIQAPDVLKAVAGQDITVKLKSNETLAAGERAIFYANGWLSGDSIAVRSVGHLPPETIMSTSRGLTAASVPHFADTQLQSHVAEADTVVSGKVSSVRLPAEEMATATPKARAAAGLAPAARGRISEHDPMWREAVIEVNDVHKGSGSPRQVVVRFPSSRDIRWHKAPKFHPGQEGVFLLKKSELPPPSTKGGAAALSAKAPAVAYTCLHAEDFQPLEKSQAIKSIVENS
jgi:hypothetical protein